MGNNDKQCSTVKPKDHAVASVFSSIFFFTILWLMPSELGVREEPLGKLFEFVYSILRFLTLMGAILLALNTIRYWLIHITENN